MLDWYGHWLRGGHDSSSSSHCPVAYRVLVPLHVHILVVTMVLVLVSVRLGMMLVLGWWC
jgi:hypothetical protein